MRRRAAARVSSRTRTRTLWIRSSARAGVVNRLRIEHAADHHADALSVKEAELSTLRRFGAPEESILIAQGNLAITYEDLGRDEEALQMKRDIYSGRLKLYGKQHEATLLAANNYASSLIRLERFVEAKSLLLKVMPVARRVLGESDTLKLTMRWNYAGVLFKDPGATLDELREAVTTLSDAERIARRVLGGSHPTTTGIEGELRAARAALHARETPPSPPPSETV